jgi:signal peptidase I
MYEWLVDSSSPRKTAGRGTWIPIVGGVVVGLPITAFIIARVLIFEPFTVPSPGMYPALRLGDRFLTQRWTARRMPERGEIVVFAYPRDPSKDFVMRVIAVAGDRLQVFRTGEIDLNGVRVPRCSLGEWPRGDWSGPGSSSLEALLETIGGHRYVVLQDRDRSESDAGSSPMYCVDEPCTVPAGSFFVMGDNRDNSFDSRFWGFVEATRVRGRARWIHIAANDGDHRARAWRDVQGPPDIPPALRDRAGACR